MPRFTRQSSALYPDHWLQWLAKYIGQPCHGLEIGCYEGRSTLWFIENICTHERSNICAVDWFKGNPDCPGADLNREQREIFDENLAEHMGLKLHWVLAEKSSIALPSLISKYCVFDWIYVDGSHESCDVISDAVMAWSLLAPGGVLFFDDYEWDRGTGPRIGVDCFLQCYAGKFNVLHRGYQIALEKI